VTRNDDNNKKKKKKKKCRYQKIPRYLFAPSLCSLVATEQETPKGSEHLRD
jgi:hypothetical protein